MTGLCALSLTLTCQELSHFTSLKFLPRLLLVQKQTLRILTASLSKVKCDSGLESAPLCLGLGTFQDKVSPDITSYMVKVGLAPSYPHYSLKKTEKERLYSTSLRSNAAVRSYKSVPDPADNRGMTFRQHSSLLYPNRESLIYQSLKG